MADEEILPRYVKKGILRQYPARPAARAIVLAWLAARFVPGHRYSESQVNEILSGHELDHASLRRYLVDEGLLDRAQGVYWRVEQPSSRAGE